MKRHRWVQSNSRSLEYVLDFDFQVKRMVNLIREEKWNFLIYFSLGKSKFLFFSLHRSRRRRRRRPVSIRMAPVLGSPGCGDPNLVAGRGMVRRRWCWRRRHEQEAEAAMAVAIPAISGKGGGLGGLQCGKGSPRMAAAELAGGCAAGGRWTEHWRWEAARADNVLTTDWKGKEKGKGIFGMENLFLPSISDDWRCVRWILELRE